jgi:hypothetical protein
MADELAPAGPVVGPNGQPVDELAPAPNAPIQSAPGGFESFGRGALQGATLGYADEISGAIESLFSNKTYEQARNESRQNFQAASTAHPFLSGLGEVGGGVASAFVPGLGLAKGASLAKTALTLGAQGAAAGLGGSNAELAGPNRDIGGAVKDTLTGGVVGAGVGGLAHVAGQGVSRLLESAPAKAVEDRAGNVAQGSGMKGSATATIKKWLAKDPEAIDKALTNGFDSAETGKKGMVLADIMRRPAKEIMPIVEERANQIGSKLGPVYQKADKLEGGFSILDFVDHINEETSKLKSSPINETLVSHLLDAKESALKAWAPELVQKLKGAENIRNLGIDAPEALKHAPDIRIPYQDFRDWVSHLQKQGVGGIRTIMDPLERQAAKQDTASALREYLNTSLETLAERHPNSGIDVPQLLKDNREFSALANIRDAVQSRLEKENAGNTSGKGHIAKAVGGLVGGAIGGAIPVPVVGHLAGAGIGMAAGTAAAAGAERAGQSATKALANVHGKLADLALRASRGDQAAANLLHKIHSTPAIMSRLAGMHANSLTEQVGPSGGQ